MSELVITSTKYLPEINATRIFYAEENESGFHDGYKKRTIYHETGASKEERNREIDEWLEIRNSQLND